MKWDKFSSGRYLLTVICGFVFAYVAYKQTLPAEAIAAIITMVFTAYFDRSDRWREQTNGKPNGEEKPK